VRLFTRTPSTNPADLAEKLADDSVHVLDVRQPGEWRHGHIRGSRNVPLMHVKSQLATLPKDKAIVTVCASGHRSAVAARTLQRSGHQVENLKGGMHAWSRAALPVERGRKR
jgi:rhodanese-related sulfurtransferase